jgi:hypothetical protein
MKPGLKRIEATLDQLGGQPIPEDLTSKSVLPDARNPELEAQNSASPPTPPKPITKTSIIEPFPLPRNPAKSSVDLPDAAHSSSPAIEPSPVPLVGVPLEVPHTPRPKPPSFSSHRHAANPNLAIGLLKEIETLVRSWQVDLEQIVQQIHALYQEGPIVEGWLESQSSGGQHVTPPVDIALLRHADVEYLMAFIEQLCQTGQPTGGDAARTDYRLCGLDADGKVWSRPCPPDQVPYVSLAIARYQKLRTLLAKKETLENRLMGLVQTLTMLHGQIRE